MALLLYAACIWFAILALCAPLNLIPSPSSLRYEDVQNEGRLDDDTQEAEIELDASVTGPLADQERDIEKMPNRTKALMQRFGGHPYENYDMIPYQVF